MKRFIIVVAMLVMTTQAGAETYSWVDDKGTYSFSDDLSSVPKKYRKKAKRLGDAGSEPAAQPPASAEKKSDAVQAPPVKPTPGAADDKQLYDGKNRDAWRQEFDVHEAELKTLEQRLDVMQKQTVNNMAAEQFATLKKEYDETKALYQQKYKVYSELIESARKAGLTVEIKK